MKGARKGTLPRDSSSSIGGRTLTRRVCSQRLEGSRFVRLQLYRLAAGGSRERLDALQFYRAWYDAARNRRDGQNLVLSHSREPPVFTRFGRVDVETRSARAQRYTPKRLPSRPWEQTRLVNVPTLSETRTITMSRGTPLLAPSSCFRLPAPASCFEKQYRSPSFG